MSGLSQAICVLRSGLQLGLRRVGCVLVVLALLMPSIATPAPAGVGCGMKCCAKGKLKCCSGKRGGGAGIEARVTCCERGPATVGGMVGYVVDGETASHGLLPVLERAAVGASAGRGGDGAGETQGRAPPGLVLKAVV